MRTNTTLLRLLRFVAVLLTSALALFVSVARAAPSTQSFTDDFTLTGGAPTQGARF